MRAGGGLYVTINSENTQVMADRDAQKAGSDIWRLKRSEGRGREVWDGEGVVWARYETVSG